MKHELKTSKLEASRRMKQKKKHRYERKSNHSKNITLYFAFMNIVLEIQTK